MSKPYFINRINRRERGGSYRKSFPREFNKGKVVITEFLPGVGEVVHPSTPPVYTRY